jgi:hypothetical protein
MLWNPLLPQYMISCHKFLWIHGRSSSHGPYVAFLTPDGICIPLGVCFFPFLSILPFTFDPCHFPWPWECRLNSHKIGVLLAIQNSVSVGSDLGSIFIGLWYWEGRARVTHVPSAGRKDTYGRTQNLFVLRYFACCFHSQHTWISKEQLISSMLTKEVENCWLVLSVTSHEDVSMFHGCGWHKIGIKALLTVTCSRAMQKEHVVAFTWQLFQYYYIVHIVCLS